MTIHFTISGKPIAKKRPRFVRRGQFVGTYNEQETEEGRWLLEAKHQLLEKASLPFVTLIPGPVILRLSFYMPVPKSTPKKTIQSIQDGKMIWHIKKPDLDNLIKFVKDCLNKFLWEDDSQVCYIAASKFYGMEPKTDIEIEAI